MMTGQPPGAKLAATASARTPAQSRNVTPARSRTSRSVWSSTARAAYRRWLADVPAVGVSGVMTAISSVAFLVPAAVNLPRHIPRSTSLLALAALGLINTGVAYWLFYLLIDQAGAATASVITYVMPVVALLLGVGLLGEQFTMGAIAGLILIGLGAWLATSRQPSSTSGHQERAWARCS